MRKGALIEPAVTLISPEHITLDESVYIGHYSILQGGKGISIGSGTWIGQNCCFDGSGGIVIGKNVGIGPGVKIITSAAGGDGLSTAAGSSSAASVIIEDDSDIGIGAKLLPGSIIGRGAQIGAGAVVQASIPPYAVAAGVPAKVIRNRRDKVHD
jgi:acetyltransferase-like isoleucine patch superfamily enzyme